MTKVGQKAVIINKDDQILVLQRSAKFGLGGKWSLPGGGLEHGEIPLEGIHREIEEEVQISVNYLKPFYVRSYLQGEEFVVIIAYRGVLRGGVVMLNEEHDAFAWLDKKAALALDLTPDAFDILEHWQLNEANPVATMADVEALWRELEAAQIPIWLDGGWGVDALLGKQTRTHDDIDIVIEEKHLPRLRELLEKKGYSDVHRNDSCAWNFVMGDEDGHLVDIHVIVFDERGDGIYGPIERGQKYPTAALIGEGSVNGVPVRCISPPWVVKFHSGYKLRDNDFHDVSLVCEKFGIELPAEYEGFVKQ